MGDRVIEGEGERRERAERVSERAWDEAALEATLGASMRGGSVIKQLRRACGAKPVR